MTDTPNTAKIFDRGFRRYEGERLGRRGSVGALVKHTLQRVIGLRRPARAKVLPILAAVLAYIPAVVFVGIAAFVPDDRLSGDFLPSYADYYGYVSAALIVFASFVAPEALCPDRQSGLLGLYLASPLTRVTYVTAKLASVVGLMALVCLGPPLLMLIAFSLQGLGPDGFTDAVTLVVRMLVAGVMMSVFYTAVALGLSSLTPRKGVAAAAIVLVIILSSAVTGTLVDSLDAPEWVYVFNFVAGPFELVKRIYGEYPAFPDIATWAVVAAPIGIIAAGFTAIVVRYRSLEVTR